MVKKCVFLWEGNLYLVLLFRAMRIRRLPPHYPTPMAPPLLTQLLVPVQSHLLQANVSGIFNLSFFVSIRRIFHHPEHYFLPLKRCIFQRHTYDPKPRITRYAPDVDTPAQSEPVLAVVHRCRLKSHWVCPWEGKGKVIRGHAEPLVLSCSLYFFHDVQSDVGHKRGHEGGVQTTKVIILRSVP